MSIKRSKVLPQRHAGIGATYEPDAAKAKLHADKLSKMHPPVPVAGSVPGIDALPEAGDCAGH